MTNMLRKKKWIYCVTVNKSLKHCIIWPYLWLFQTVCNMSSGATPQKHFKNQTFTLKKCLKTLKNKFKTRLSIQFKLFLKLYFLTWIQRVVTFLRICHFKLFPTTHLFKLIIYNKDVLSSLQVVWHHQLSFNYCELIILGPIHFYCECNSLQYCTVENIQQRLSSI